MVALRRPRLRLAQGSAPCLANVRYPARSLDHAHASAAQEPRIEARLQVKKTWCVQVRGKEQGSKVVGDREPTRFADSRGSLSYPHSQALVSHLLVRSEPGVSPATPGVRAGTTERAGYLTSQGTEPIPAPIGA